jgi:hypothetical protein
MEDIKFVIGISTISNVCRSETPDGKIVAVFAAAHQGRNKDFDEKPNRPSNGPGRRIAPEIDLRPGAITWCCNLRLPRNTQRIFVRLYSPI